MTMTTIMARCLGCSTINCYMCGAGEWERKGVQLSVITISCPETCLVAG
jgi:hypothetical protein